MEAVWLLIAVALMLVGLVGTMFPVIPSVILIYCGYIVYGLGTGWRDYGLTTMIVFGLITVLTQVVDYLAGALGASRYGGSKAGVWGSIIGAVLGVIFFNVIGLIVGTFGGAVVGELASRRPMEEAVRSGWGAFLGFIGGSLFKIMVAILMTGVFFWKLVV